ncbi:MAG: hypothetical protein BWY09_02487 [Candidatus Hydrogenedentes bacterium ADurb.Bin179]|nr:MAG: hypothetical protein BWY09_02487 [Candidatus Hydrogenedentes bacterium ADurb.Bin179]
MDSSLRMAISSLVPFCSVFFICLPVPCAFPTGSGNLKLGTIDITCSGDQEVDGHAKGFVNTTAVDGYYGRRTYRHVHAWPAKCAGGIAKTSQHPAAHVGPAPGRLPGRRRQRSHPDASSGPYRKGRGTFLPCLHQCAFLYAGAGGPADRTRTLAQRDAGIRQGGGKVCAGKTAHAG